MHLWADVWDAAGSARLGDGPVPLVEAAVTRRLDGVGGVTIRAPGSDARAALLQNERRVRVYADGRELGRGVIRRVIRHGTPDQWTVTADGADELDLLTRRNTLLGRVFRQQTPAQIAAALVGLVSGWTVSGSGGNVTDVRFDGVSIWQALLGLVESHGLHVRAGSTPNSVEIGAMGANSGLRLIAPADPDSAGADVGLIERITITHDSEAAATRLFPVGAGIGEALLTLASSTRTSPYSIQSVTGGSGGLQYFMEDTAGVSALGVIEKVGKFRGAAPLSNNPADLINAANALYDIAAAWLARYSTRQDGYRVVCRGVSQTVRPGDKVRLRYRGVVEREGETVTLLDVDANFWVMEVTDSARIDGLTTTFTLSSVDRHAQDAAQIVIGALEDITVDGVSVKPYFNRSSWVYDRLIDPANPALIPVRFTDATQRLSRCTLRVKTRPFTATATAATGGGLGGLGTNTAGDHAHAIGTAGSESFSGPYFWRKVTINGADAMLPISVESASVSLDTGSSGAHSHLFSIPNHTHALTYGLQQDTQTPDTLRVYVNGVDRTAALGGAWAVGGGAVTFEIDVTSAILSAANLQQDHEIRITCAAGRGAVEASIEVYEVIMSVAV